MLIIFVFVLCKQFFDVNTSESGSEIPVKFWNVVLEKKGEDQFEQSCEKWASESEEGEEYFTCSKTNGV